MCARACACSVRVLCVCIFVVLRSLLCSAGPGDAGAGITATFGEDVLVLDQGGEGEEVEEEVASAQPGAAAGGERQLSGKFRANRPGPITDAMADVSPDGPPSSNEVRLFPPLSLQLMFVVPFRSPPLLCVCLHSPPPPSWVCVCVVCVCVCVRVCMHTVCVCVSRRQRPKTSRKVPHPSPMQFTDYVRYAAVPSTSPHSRCTVFFLMPSLPRLLVAFQNLTKVPRGV